TRWPRDWSSDVCSSDLHRPPGVASALGFWLPAVSPYARNPRRSSQRSENVSRKETSLRHAHLSRHRILPFGLEHGKRFFLLEQTRLSRPQAAHRRTPSGTFPRCLALRKIGRAHV